MTHLYDMHVCHLSILLEKKPLFFGIVGLHSANGTQLIIYISNFFKIVSFSSEWMSHLYDLHVCHLSNLIEKTLLFFGFVGLHSANGKQLISKTSIFYEILFSFKWITHLYDLLICHLFNLLEEELLFFGFVGLHSSNGTELITKISNFSG